MKRIYFLVPDVNVAKKIVDSLLLARIEERRIHVLARQGTPMETLPEATFLQKTDFIPALEQGLAVGGLTGIVAGLVAVALPVGAVVGGGAVLATALVGSGIGAFASSMIGSSVDNRQIQQFAAAIEGGALLMMVDVPRSRVDEIEEIVGEHYPQAVCQGVEPTIPPFP